MSEYTNVLLLILLAGYALFIAYWLGFERGANAAPLPAKEYPEKTKCSTCPFVLHDKTEVGRE